MYKFFRYIIITLFLSFLGLNQGNATGETLAAPRDYDFEAITLVTDAFLARLKVGDTPGAVGLLSPNAKDELKNNLLSSLKGVVTIGITDISGGKLDENIYKVVGTYRAKGEGWQKEGFQTYFIYEKYEGGWRIVDTDIYKAGEVGKVLMIIGCIVLLLLIGQVWMIIDCARKPEQPGKVKWLLINILVPFGFLVYYFTGKKKLKSTQV